MTRRRARASGYPEGGGGAGDGFLLPVSTRTSFAGKTVGRRGEMERGPLPRPRDGFLLSQERRWASSCPRKRVPRGERWGGGWIPAPRFHEDKLRRKDGGASGGDGARPLPRPRDGFLLSQERRWGVGGRWGQASPASQGWIPAFAGKTVGRRGQVGPGLHSALYIEEGRGQDPSA